MQIDVVSAAGLSFSYETKPVLRDVAFSVAAGDYVGLVGPNGSGKSTLVRLLLGLEAPGAGSISLFGVPSQSFQEWHRVGYLPQKNAALSRFFPATVQEIVALGLVQKGSHHKGGRSGSHARKAVSRAMELVDIADIGGRLIGSAIRRPAAAGAARAGPRQGAGTAHPRRADYRDRPGDQGALTESPVRAQQRDGRDGAPRHARHGQHREVRKKAALPGKTRSSSTGGSTSSASPRR